jgi:hypothetical protein
VFAVRLPPTGEVTLTVPAGVEVGTPTLRLESGPAPAVSVRAEPGRLRVGFDPPAEAPGWLTLPLMAGGPVLRCPTAGAAERFAAIRGGPLAGVGRAGVIDYPADGLKPFADVPELRLTASPPARVFQRRPGQEVELTPTLAPPPAEPLAADTVWTVGPVLTAAGTVRAERAAAGVIAFDLPSEVTVLDARAGDGSRWTRTGSRVSVWLPAGTADSVTVTWAGTQPGGEVVELAGPPGGTVRVEATDGWAATTEGSRTRVFPPAPPPATLLEVVERTGDGLTWRAVVGLPLAARPHRFRLTVSDLPTGVTPTLRGDGVGPAERTADSVTWPVDVGGPVTLALTARLPVGRRPEVTVRFDGPPLPWAARGLVVGAGLTADGRPASPSQRDAMRGRWPAEADAGTVWAADGDDRKVALAEAPKPAPPPTAEPTPPQPVTTANWPAAAGWLLAFGLAMTLLPAGPERLAAVGVLGAVAVGGTVGWGFLLLAAAGGLWRLGRLV